MTGTVLDGISQSHPVDKSDRGLIGLQCSACDTHIGFLEMDPKSSQFTYLVHTHSITKKENTYICTKCGETIFDRSPYMSTNQYMKFKIPVNEEALKYEILNLSVNQLNLFWIIKKILELSYFHNSNSPRSSISLNCAINVAFLSWAGFTIA